jgi:hypothetical protein
MELGNMMFNTNKNQIYECPEWIVALLEKIENKLDIVMHNKYGKEYDSPFRNSGNSYKNKVFEVQAYSWDDEVHQEYNFKCGDVEISWYKYLCRDTTINDNYEEKYIIEIFNKCIESLNKENMKILKEIE